MERVPMIVQGISLRPGGAEAIAVLSRLKVGQRVQVEIYQERPKFLSNKAAKVFELIGQAKGMRVRNVRGWIAVGTGRADLVDIGGGKVTAIPHGTGPRDMSGEQFVSFWHDACEFIERVVFPGITPEHRALIAPLLRNETGESRPAPTPF
jgi:hypothetical protein